MVLQVQSKKVAKGECVCVRACECVSACVIVSMGVREMERKRVREWEREREKIGNRCFFLNRGEN